MAPDMERKVDRAGGCWTKPTGRNNWPRVSNGCGKFLCVCAGVSSLKGKSSLKVRSPSHGGRFRRVRNALGLWATGSEQGGDSKSYTGAQI